MIQQVWGEGYRTLHSWQAPGGTSPSGPQTERWAPSKSLGIGKKTGRREDDPDRCKCWELCWLCPGASRDLSAHARGEDRGEGMAWHWWTHRTVCVDIVTKNWVQLLVGVEPINTTKPKTERRKDLLLLAASKENTGHLSQSNDSPTARIGEFLS